MRYEVAGAEHHTDLAIYACHERDRYGAQNEAYMSRSAEKWVRDLCFNELGVCG